MFIFNKYPPTFIPLEYWVHRVNEAGKTEYPVAATVWAWITKNKQFNLSK